MKSYQLAVAAAATLCACADAFIAPGAINSALAPMSSRQVTSLGLRGASRVNRVAIKMAEPAADSLPIGIENSDYIAFGLAQCYTMNDGKLEPYWVMEPLTGATLECITGQQHVGAEKKIETSYKRAMALTAGQVLIGGVEKPTGINVEALAPLLKGEEGHLCEDALQRTLAAGRTLKRRVESQVLAMGEVREGFNFRPEANKRVLNAQRVVNDDDNVKQDISIDVYGRDKDGGKSKSFGNNLGEMV